MSILIVIDMQEKFSAALSPFLQNTVVQEIELAKAKNDQIILLRYNRHGRILKNIREAINGYENVIYKKKTKDDGARVIANCVSPEYEGRFKICGVNTGGCVLKTVQSLAVKFQKAKINVVNNACASQSGLKVHLKALDKMSRLKNVKII